jgi:hypothetical protein
MFGSRDVLKVINPTKASGPDLINPRLLKEATPIIKHPLCKLFNLSLMVASYPSQWKRANITPVFKNNKQNDVNNYRPISLLSVISKSHNLISLIWFVTCNKLGILLLQSSISDCFEKYILNKFALSISSNIKLSLWRIEVTSLVRNAKDKYNNDLITKITNMNSSCKNWWNIVKQISE